MPVASGAHALGRALVDREIGVGNVDAGCPHLLGQRDVRRAAGRRGDHRVGLGVLELRQDRRPVRAVHRQIFLADDLAAGLLDVAAGETEHAAAEGIVAADQEVGLGAFVLGEIVDDRRHLLLGHPGVDVQIFVAGMPFVEGGVDIGDAPLADGGQAGVARRARLHRDQRVDLLLIDERVERLLGAGRARSVVGDFERKLAAEHAAGGVDLVDGELRLLHDRGRDHAIGAGQADRHADGDRAGIGGVRGRGEEQADGAGGQRVSISCGASPWGHVMGG